MSPVNPKRAASVRARLRNVAKTQGVDFQQVLVRFALERILYPWTPISGPSDLSMGISVLLLTLNEAANLPACLAPAVADDVHGPLAALFRALSQLSGAVGASRPLSLQAGRPG